MSIANKYVHSAYKAIFQQDYAKAIKYFQQAIYNNPRNPSLYYKLAITYKRNKQYLEAYEAMQEALAIEQKDAYLLYAKHLYVKVELEKTKQALAEGEDLIQAIHVLEPLVEDDPNSIELHWLLAQLYHMTKKTGKATKQIEILTKLAPEEDWHAQARLLRSETNYVH